MLLIELPNSKQLHLAPPGSDIVGLQHVNTAYM